MENMTRFELKHIVLLGACSLALSAGSALCDGQLKTAASSPLNALNGQNNIFARAGSETHARSHTRQQLQQQQQYLPVHRAQDLTTRQSHVTPRAASAYSGLDPIASSTFDSMGLAPVPNSQPSVYHSIIDRTDTPSRRKASPAIQSSGNAIIDGDLHTAAGHHHGHAYGKYYEYRAVPKKKTWKFGYKRGNHKHTISRHEHGKAGKHPHFKTKVKWHDKKSKGKGIHLWDYNHHDKKHYGHHG